MNEEDYVIQRAPQESEMEKAAKIESLNVRLLQQGLQIQKIKDSLEKAQQEYAGMLEDLAKLNENTE